MTDIQDLTMNPYDAVRAQLGRQKWAVDTRDATALEGIYTRECKLAIYTGGREAPTEVKRLRGRDAIVAFIVAGWECTADGWYPGSMIHRIGTVVLEPSADGRIGCRSYATYLNLSASGTAEVHGYGQYHDSWAIEEGAWRLASRETVVYGITLGAPRSGGRGLIATMQK